MDYPKSYKSIRTGRASLERWLESHYPEFSKYISATYVDMDIKQALYMFYNKIESVPFCVCGQPVKFHGYKYGFSKFCSSTCASKDPEVRSKTIQTIIDRYGNDYRDLFNEKSANTKLEKYGDSKYNNIDKMKSTCLEKYGVDNAMKCVNIQSKSKQTCLEKYGSEYYLTSNEAVTKRQQFIDKIKETCIERYGVPSVMQDGEIKSRVRETCLKKYGVDWNCMRDEAHNSRNTNSGPNEFFASLLDLVGISYEREYIVGSKSFDFRIGKYLVEINPSATHNVTWNPFGGKIIQKDYHLEKTKIGVDAGFQVIHVWDWDDINKIVNIVCDKQRIYARKCQIELISTNELNDFLETYHLQGTCRGQKIRIGLKYLGELVGIMTFGKPRYNGQHEWELLRLNFGKYNIIGGAEKMMAYFVRKYNPKSIISYCDNSKFTGLVYSRMGFIKSDKCLPSKHWYNCRTNTHITNNLLMQRGFDQLFGTSYGKSRSNEDLMRENGFVEIFDAGQIKWVWSKNTTKS